MLEGSEETGLEVQLHKWMQPGWYRPQTTDNVTTLDAQSKDNLPYDFFEAV